MTETSAAETDMADKILVNYPALQDMAKHCEQAAMRLNRIADVAQSTAVKMQDGVLQGSPGDTFADALDLLEKSTRRLSSKLAEIVKDINGAISDMQQADGNVRAKF